MQACIANLLTCRKRTAVCKMNRLLCVFYVVNEQNAYFDLLIKDMVSDHSAADINIRTVNVKIKCIDNNIAV